VEQERKNTSTQRISLGEGTAIVTGIYLQEFFNRRKTQEGLACQGAHQKNPATNIHLVERIVKS